MQIKQRYVADQRSDLPQYEKMLEYIEREFQTYAKSFISPVQRVVKNWLIENNGGLEVRISNASDSVLLNTERSGKEDLYRRLSTEALLTLDLPDNAVSYVEVQMYEETSVPESVAIWDTTADGGNGAEFTQTVDTATIQNFRLVSNIVGFTGDADKVQLAIVTTMGGVITNIQDERQLLFTLISDWNFGSPRTDKGIGSLKEVIQALMTSIKEIKSTSNWYDLPWINPTLRTEVVWYPGEGNAPERKQEFNLEVYAYEAGLGQNLIAYAKVPQGYTPGFQIKLFSAQYSPSAAQTQLLEANVGLIRKDQDQLDTPVAVRNSTNSVITNTLSNQYREAVIDLTTVDGKIGTYAVNPGDLLKISLARGTDTDPEDIRFIPTDSSIEFL